MEIKNAKHRLVVDDADLSGSTFRDVNLSHAVLEDINLRGSKLQNINLSDVEIDDCNVSGMRIDGVLVADALEAYRKLHPAVPTNGVSPLSGGTELRPFHEADEVQVVALWKSVFGYSAPHNDPVTVIRMKLQVDRELFVVAVRDGEVIGTVMGGYDGHRGWLYSLAVRPDCRLQGIARALVKRMENELHQRGCLKLNLQVLATNAETAAFYKRLGYVVEDRINLGKLLGPGACLNALHP
jgi:ribosomal protein S18 acetylase RimI-like enzyme